MGTCSGDYGGSGMTEMGGVLGEKWNVGLECLGRRRR